MDTKRICPSCQKPLAPDVPMGLCPECLIKAGFPTGVDTETKTAARSAFVPPAVEEIAKLFPQLEVLELIGKGGMGAVYKARQKRLNRFVALKILPPGIGQEPAFAERFTREAQALAQLNHPGIVTLYEFGETSGQFYFLMEYVDGVNLRQLLANSRVSTREALAIVPQICDALQFAHDQGIVHRDIKPENILLDRRGRVKVADFGLAKIMGGQISEPNAAGVVSAGSTTLTDASKVMGTPQYMSPEQIHAPGEVDHRADIYALGVVFYQMLTGELPGKQLQPPSKKVQIDVRLDEIVLRALEKKPELRYQQASILKTQIETIVSTPAGSQREEAQTEKSEIVPRFSLPAIVGACLPLLTFMPMIFMPILAMSGKHSEPVTQRLLQMSLLLLGLPGLLVTTILGWVAVTQIRRSAGKIHGLWLAVFDGLLFPLLALDAVIGGVWIFILKVVFMDHLMIPVCALLALATIVGIDYLIIRRVWRAVNRPVAAPAPPVQKPDRFWRWFAVTVLALISIPIVIAILGLLAAIAIPNFVKARHVSQQNAAREWTQQGWQLWQAHKLADAAAKFQQAVQLVPDDANAWNGLGWAQFNGGDSVAAEASFQKAITIETNQPGALNGLGQIYLSQRKYDDAEMYLLKAAPQAPAAWFGLARLYLLEGKFEQAEIWAQKIVDSGQADDIAKKMLEAAKAKQLSEELRRLIEPPSAAPNLSFGPVIERTLKVNGKECDFLVFRSGEVLHHSYADGDANDSTPPTAFMTWGKENGADAGFCASTDNFYSPFGLLALDMGTFRFSSETIPNTQIPRFRSVMDWQAYNAAHHDSPAKNPLIGSLVGVTNVWNDLTADQLLGPTNDVPAFFLKEKLHGLWFSPTNIIGPIAFSTRDGSVGLLQITGITENPRGVKIRYKLVQNSEAQKPKPATVTGEVTDQNGKPLANVRWRISAVEEWRDGQWELIHNLGWPQWSVTDAEGRFTLTFQGKQCFDLQFAGFGELAPGFVYEVSPDMRDLKIVMKPGIPVRGTVVASNSNRIPGYVRVELQLPGRDVWYQEESATDADGHFTFYVCPLPTEPNKAIPSKWQISCAGLVTPFEATTEKSIGMNLLVDARAEIVVNTNTSASTTPPIAASTPKPDGSPVDDVSKAAVSAAEKWLAAIDGGNYSLTWKDASAFFQAAVTEQAWNTSMETYRKPLGDLVSRKLESAQPATSLPGAPDGEYVVMQFDTSFAAKKTAVETVTFTHEKDGSWRASGYYIR